jgi:hypothetical protein
MNTKTSLKSAAAAACLISGATQATLIPALNGHVFNNTDRTITLLADFNLAATNTFRVSGISLAVLTRLH